MAIRIMLECGHASMLRMRSTPEGYTHDWEVFVRGVDNADIHQYIEKVIFILHNTFRNPKRVLKEPPFILKESGYAGFIIPIEIYLRNKDEPRKFEIQYDLTLQPNGPPINNVIRHIEVINNPSDEFRKKLLKGGAVAITNRDGSLEKNDTKTSSMIGKPRVSSNEIKKHRITESKTSNSFHELFGPPIKTAKISPDTKKTQPDKNLVPKPVIVAEKSDKMDKVTKIKENLKDSRKDKQDEKKDKRMKDSSRDKLRNKEKSKRPLSPGNKSYSSPTSKRPVSPVIMKKSVSPFPPSLKRPPSPKSREKDLKKILPEKERDIKEKDKAKINSKSVIDSFKSEKKKEKKKHKEDRDKEKRDRSKEMDKSYIKDVAKVIEKKSEKSDKIEKLDREKSQEYKSSRDGRKSPKSVKESDKIRDDKMMRVDKLEKNEKFDKTKDGKTDKDRQKHKHKKKDKKDKRDSNREREKKEKRERSKDRNEKQNNVSSNVSAGNPLLTLLAEIPERDSSDSGPSLDDESLSETKSTFIVKREMEHIIPAIPGETTKPSSPGVAIEIKKEKNDRNRRDKSRGSKGEERENRKRKRKSESKGDDKLSVKREKDRDHSTSPPLEPVSSSQSPVTVDIDSAHLSDNLPVKKLKAERDIIEQIKDERSIETDVEQVAPDSTNSTLVDTDISEPPVFSEDYVSQLKDLQQKIMTLQDNQELQRVVQVIAETGQYEITKKTFDFDLCALDRRTVQRLQQFFSAS